MPQENNELTRYKKTVDPKQSDVFRQLERNVEEQALPKGHVPNHSHAWHGVWDRPVKVDEDSLHPFTVARMTDHNVKGRDD